MKSQDAILTWAVRAVVVLLIGALGYLGYLVVTNRLAQKTGSPAGRAAENLVLAVRKNPNNVALRIKFAEALTAAGRLTEADEQYRAALKIEPENPGALAGLAGLAMHDEEWAKAQGYWEKLIELLSGAQMSAQDQRLEQAYFYLGTALLEQEQYEDAVGALKRALGIRRDASDTYYLLSYAYGKLEIPEKQRENLESALKFDPRLAEANYDLGTMLLKEDLGRAAECFRVSVDNAPEGRDEPRLALDKLGPFSDRMAQAQALSGSDPKKALVEARVAVALEPEDASALRLLATLYEKTEDRDKARDYWDAVLRMLPKDAEAQAAIKRLEKVGK